MSSEEARFLYSLSPLCFSVLLGLLWWLQADPKAEKNRRAEWTEQQTTVLTLQLQVQSVLSY